MNRRQSNVYNMAKSLVVFFGKSEPVWEAEELVVVSVDRIIVIVDKIADVAALQKKNETPAYTATKDQQRGLLENEVYRFCGRMMVYAVKEEDAMTAKLVKITRTKISNMSINKLLSFSRVIADVAEELLVDLAAYKLTQVDVDSLRELIVSTERLAAERDSAKGEHCENTLHLERLFKELQTELKLMDTQVVAYIEDKEFLDTYFFTRRVYDVRGGSGKKEEVVEI